LSARVRFHEAARDEYLAAAIRYEDARPGLGMDFQGEVDDYVDKAAAGILPGSRTTSVQGHDIRTLPLSRSRTFSISSDEATS